ncbi:MAG: YidC/Oxa1 family membrane protein insertase [Candidatus Izemoplasmatales bacterium]|jgi:YidC/Oxa1 family membrane protein insertase|nr:YidC/Oxa1 family membrane protein insertase [Candidatus Izemoplasmatales bacterium]
MKKNKIVSLFLMLLLVFTLSSCGTKTGVVSYSNYTAIVVEAEGVDQATVTGYFAVLTSLGTPDDLSTYDTTSGDGYLDWTSEDYSVHITFVATYATEKTQTGLYASVYQSPIGVKTGVWEWIIVQIGTFTFHASNLFGLLGDTYYYWIGLLLMTLVIRTIAWPVYAKSNDLTIKMQMAQPELDKLKEKYAGKNDQASQQRMQMETMDVYKRYKINFLGCLMPVLQMPIFIAMYQVVQRFPLTDTAVFGNGAVVLNTNFLWTTLGNTFSFSSFDMTAFLSNLPLAIIVGVTMFLSQWLLQKRQKKNQKRVRYQDPKAQQSQKTMQYFMYFMVLMMAYIALGNAGIAFYWIIGNSYQLLQSYISHRQSGQREEQLRKQF